MPAPATPWEERVTRAMRTCVRTFGDGPARIYYTHRTGPAYFTNGIFEAMTESIDLNTGATVTAYQPRVSFALADLQALAGSGDGLLIRGQTFEVIDVNYDGQGTVELRLHEVSATSEP